MDFTIAEVAQALAQRYVSYRQRFVASVANTPEARLNTSVDGAPSGKQSVAIFIPKGKDGKPRSLTDTDIFGHLHRHCAVSVYAGPKTSKFLCLDVDVPSVDVSKHIVECLEDLGLRPVVSTSGNKGYHIEVLADALVPTETWRVLYKYVCGRLGLSEATVEFRPTATQSIKLPLSAHPKTGNMCWYLDPHTFAPIERLDYVLELPVESASHIRDLADTLLLQSAEPESQTIRSDGRGSRSESRTRSQAFRATYPPLKELGTRLSLMRKISTFLHYSGATNEEIAEELRWWVAQQNPNLYEATEADIAYDIVSLADWRNPGPGLRRPASEPPKPREQRDPSHVVFKEADAKLLAAQSSKLRRQLLFLVMRGQKRFGAACLTHELQSELLGCSLAGAEKTVRSLKADGIITVSVAPAKHTSNGFVCRKPNKYTVCALPAVCESDRELEIQVSEDWRRDYATVLRYFFDSTTISKFMTKKELEAFNYESAENPGS